MKLLSKPLTAVAAAVATTLLAPVALASASHSTASARPATTVVHGKWGKGQLVPGIAALNTGGDAAVTAISCTSPGYCTAGGYYTSAAKVPTSSSSRRAFVASEVKGRWGTARQVPGTGLAKSDGWTSVTAISCVSPGNCLVGGYDGTGTAADGVKPSQGFVASEVKGTWGTARQLSLGHPVEGTTVTSVSCTLGGECLAGGYTLYPKTVDDGRVYLFGYEFVVEQQHARWGALRALTAETLLYETPASVTCVSPGNCAAAVGASVNPVVAQENRGTWRRTALPGFPAGTADTAQGPTVVACPKAGACTVGGTYVDLKVGGIKVWVASESSYRWKNGMELAGLALGGVTSTTVNAISCTAPGYCTMAGQIWSSNAKSATSHGFTATQAGGRWSRARIVVSGASGDVPAISCPAVGYCVAAVDNTSYAPHVIEEAGGTWHKMLVLPGLTSRGSVTSVSCAKPGWCTAGGSYSVRNENQAIVADEKVA